MGERPALVLIPGLVCTERLWRDQVAALADLANITVTTAQTAFDSVTDVAAAILAEAPARFALAGLSYGGYVVFEILRQAPERVTRLALLNTRAGVDDEARLQMRRDQVRLAGRGRFLGVSDQLLRRFLHPDRLTDEALVADVKAMAEAVGREGFIRQQTAIIARSESLSMLPEIACPTLVVAGRQDGSVSFEEQEAMANAIPGAEFVVIEDCGHLSTMERPDEVNAALRRWLTRDCGELRRCARSQVRPDPGSAARRPRPRR